MSDKKKSRAAKSVPTDKLGAPGTFRSLFELLMEYQKMLNREAREDRRKLTRKRRDRLLLLAERLAAENKAIDRLLDEAGERYQRLLHEAIAELASGFVIGLAKLEFELVAHEDAILHTRRAVNRLLRQLRKVGDNLEP